MAFYASDPAILAELNAGLPPDEWVHVYLQLAPDERVRWEREQRRHAAQVARQWALSHTRRIGGSQR